MDTLSIAYKNVNRFQEKRIRSAISRLKDLVLHDEEYTLIETFGSVPETDLSVQCEVKDGHERWSEVQEFLDRAGLLEEAIVELDSPREEFVLQLYPSQ